MFFVFFSWSFGLTRATRGRARTGPQAKPGPAEGAVKAGPLGPPVGAALTVPGLGPRQHHWHPSPARGSLVAYGVDGHSSDVTVLKN